jgi:hypothetical protein
MTRFSIGALLVLILSTSGAITADNEPTLSKTPISAEQLEVYRAFLRSYSNGSRSEHLNLANRTRPLDLTEEKKEEAKCFEGIDLENEKEAATTFHLFDPKINLSERATLVNPDHQEALIKENDPQRTIMKENQPVKDAVETAFASGLLTLSEVAFDKSHNYAVMSFSFVCGGLCGHGETLVFEKIEGKWVRTKRSCGSWIS